MRLYLAVDCGGTKAAAVVCDGRGRALGRGLGGPANFTDVGWHVFFRSLRTAVDHAMAQVREHAASPDAADDDGDLFELCRLWAIQSRAWKRRSVHAGIAPTPATASAPRVFEAAWLGVAGVDSATTVHLLSPPVAALLGLPPPPTPRLTVANDTSLLAAPVHDLPPRPNASRVGVVVIAGTGSIVTGYRLGKNSTDLASFGRVGGLGWLLGDEGSGYAVGREAIRAVLRQADAARFVDDSDDEEEDTDDFSSLLSDTEGDEDAYPYALRDRILAEFGLSSTDELFGVIYAPESDKNEPSSSEQQHPSSAPSSPQSKRDDRLLPPGPSAPTPERPVTPVAPLSTERPSTPASQTTASEGEGSPSAQEKEAALDEQRAEETLSAAQQWAESVAGPPAAELERDRTIRARRRNAPAAPAERKTAAAVQAPKHRLAALAPLVFHLAFVHQDPLALLVLRTQADCIARQIAELVRPTAPSGGDSMFWAWDYAGATRAGRHRRPRANDAVLCMGGSLLGVDAYADLLLSQLTARGVHFARACFVPDPARSGALALARAWEARLSSDFDAGADADADADGAEVALRGKALETTIVSPQLTVGSVHTQETPKKVAAPIPIVAELV